MDDTQTMIGALSFSLANRVPKLDGKNYNRWKRSMQLRLQSAKLWDVVSSARPEAISAEAWAESEAKALTDINDSCDDPQQDLIGDCTSPKQAWELLQATYAPRTAANTNRMWRDFEACRQKPSEPVMDYYTRVKSAPRNIRSLGEQLPESRLLERLLMGLNSDFEMMKANFNLRANFTEQDCLDGMLAEESRLAAYTASKDSNAPQKNDDHRSKKKNDRGRNRSRSPSRSPRRRSPRRRSTSRSCRNDNRNDNRSDRYNPANTGPAWDGIGCWGCGRHNHSASDCWLLHPNLHPSRLDQPSNQNTQNPAPNASNIHPQRLPYVQAAHVAYSHPAPPNFFNPIAPDHAIRYFGHDPIAIPSNNDFPYPVADPSTQQHHHALQMQLRLRDRHALFQMLENENPPPLVINDVLYSIEHDPDLQHQWLIDSGATNHYSAHRNVFINFRPCPEIPVDTGAGRIFAKGVGDIVVNLPLPYGRIVIQDVMWVPQLMGYSNLLSVPQLTRTGFSVLFSALNSKIMRSNIVVALGSLRGKAFYLDISLPSHLAMLSGTTDTQPLEVWHKRLGHLNQDAIHKLTTMATGIEMGPNRPPSVSMRCDPCLKAGQTHLISRIVRSPETKILGCVHIDLKSPCLNKSVHGFRFFMTCTDEKTRLTRTYPLLTKSDAFKIFVTFQMQAERETLCKLLEIQIDGGGEFLSNDLRTYCANTGIKIRITAPYCPEMNGIAKRVNRTLTENASALLWTAQLPIGFWAPAILVATFLKNRCPTKALPDITPYEAYYGTKPNLGFIRIFGCKAKVVIPSSLRSKTVWD